MFYEGLFISLITIETTFVKKQGKFISQKLGAAS